MSWAELVREQHGERQPLQPDVPPAAAAPPERSPEPAPVPEPPRPAAPAAPAPRMISDAAVDRIDRRIDRVADEVAASAAAVRDRLEQLRAELGPRVEGVEAELESSISVLFEQIGRIDDKLAAVEGRLSEQMDSLRIGVDALQSAFHGALDRLEASEAPKAKPAPAPGAAGAGGNLELNGATFEDLRTLGLSVTQAARIIAYRDTRGGFSNLEQLREVRGLSHDDLQMLIERARL